MASPADAIQAAIAAGYAQAAMAIGQPHRVFRPSSASNPLDPGNLVATLPAAWKPPSLGDAFKGANGFGKATWFGYYDLRTVRVGDYMVRQSDDVVFFIAAQQPMLQPVAVECNAVLSFERPGSKDEGFGVIQYGGTEQPRNLLTSWPASLLQGTKGERADDGLPRDSRQPWYSALLPVTPGVDIRTEDVAVDERGYRYLVSSAERSALGWRLSLAYAGT